MAAEKYEWPIFKRCFYKLFKISCTGKNLIFPVLLIPLLVGTLFTNKLYIRTTRIFGMLLKKQDGVTLKDYISLYIAAEVLNLIFTASFDTLVMRIYSQSKNICMKDYMSIEWDEFKKHTIGGISLRHFEKAEAASILIYTVFHDIFNNGAFLIEVLRNIFLKDSRLVFLILFTSVMIHIMIFFILLKYHNLYNKNYTASKALISSVVANEVSNFDIIKSYNLENSSVDRVYKANLIRKESKNKLSIFNGKTEFLYKSLEILSLFTIFLISGNGYTNVDLISIITFSITVHRNLRNFLKSVIKTNESFYSFYLFESDIKEHHKNTSNVGMEGLSSEISQPIDTIKNIEAKNLSCENVYSNVNFNIKNGEKIAIVGKNGSGKTVLIKTIMGFIPYKGSLLVNGKEFTSYNISSLRSIITMVSQSDAYTAGSIMKNLKYGNNKSEENIIEACREWNIHHIIEAMDGKYNKNSSTNGAELSGGQKQRISLMRAILRDTEFLLLDECLSSINTSDRLFLIDKILSLKNKTIIMVVKSENLISNFDKVLILNGKESCYGTPKDLELQLNEHFQATQ